MRPINILLADDDPLDIIDISRQLDKQHIIYHLYEAHNGEEAIGILEEGPELPDIALIDINMPKMNGLELLHAIRQNEGWKNLKCFIITTSDEKIDRRAAALLGLNRDQIRWKRRVSGTASQQHARRQRRLGAKKSFSQ